MKLWAKGYKLDAMVEQFTVGEDYLLDQNLVPFDCIASFAHATMLRSIGLLNDTELAKLRKGLQAIYTLSQKGEFAIEAEQEDCHTAIENFLVANCGDVGKKIHSARSRNDQVLVALRLYMKTHLLKATYACATLAKEFAEFAKAHHDVAIPGRTHMQLAMPSSLGLWAGAIAESLADDAQMLKNSYELIDQCPLGSASSYGSAIPVDRQLCSDLLGFAKVQNNVLYANNSRGKFEAVVIQALHQVMLTLSKAASDLMFFSLPEIGYLKLPQQLCSGSSLMPQKRNPCALELVRAKSGTTSSLLLQVLEIIRSLPSGYHRDFQETKAPLMKSVDITLASMQIVSTHLVGLKVNREKCLSAFSPELFATDEVLALTQQGLAFREAYQQIAANAEKVSSADPVANILAKTHMGAPGNLGLDIVASQIKVLKVWLNTEQDHWLKIQNHFDLANEVSTENLI